MTVTHADMFDIVLDCQGIRHGFGPVKVLHDVNLEIIRGEIVGVVGPSGCGKSTLLRAIVGTHPPNEGEVRIKRAGASTFERVDGPGRDRGIVYQHYSLFPFLTARQNVAMGLKLDQTTLLDRWIKWPKWRALRKEHLREADALLEKLKLGHATNLYPHEMSGGMRQRVAIAQALVMKPEILLLDEPFGALDEATREELQRMLLTLYEENVEAQKQGAPPPYTILIVTHELNEAIYVSDRVVGLSQYWNWAEQGLDKPGATIVYDHTAPISFSDQIRDYDGFVAQRESIRKLAFEPSIPQDPATNRRFWDDVRAGKGEGVLRSVGAPSA